jgi:hypothetical protein
MGEINGIGRCDFCDKRLSANDSSHPHVSVIVKSPGELGTIIVGGPELEFCNIEEMVIWFSKTLESLPSFQDKWQKFHERYDELAREGHQAWIKTLEPQQTPEEAYQAPQ